MRIETSKTTATTTTVITPANLGLIFPEFTDRKTDIVKQLFSVQFAPDVCREPERLQSGFH